MMMKRMVEGDGREVNDEGGIDEEWSESDSNAHDGERYIMRTLLTSISLFFNGSILFMKLQLHFGLTNTISRSYHSSATVHFCQKLARC